MTPASRGSCDMVLEEEAVVEEEAVLEEETIAAPTADGASPTAAAPSSGKNTGLRPSERGRSLPREAGTWTSACASGFSGELMK